MAPKLPPPANTKAVLGASFCIKRPVCRKNRGASIMKLEPLAERLWPAIGGRPTPLPTGGAALCDRRQWRNEKAGRDTMRALIAFALGFVALPALADEDIVLRGMGSFHIGGRIAEVSGKPVTEIQRVPGGPMSKLDRNGQFMVEQMYVQYFLPKNRKGKYPLLMWHGAGLTGATYESTPDGREGWENIFIRKGWDTYVSDAVERGRSGFASADVWENDQPIFLNYQDPYERFRIGQGAGSWNADPAKRKPMPGTQFPVEAYDNYMKQSVPRWLSTDKAVVAAYLALVDKICPCVLIAHSQGGHFAFLVAEQRPGKIKAIVAVESASAGKVASAAKLKDIPVMMLFGDYVDQ